MQLRSKAENNGYCVPHRDGCLGECSALKWVIMKDARNEKVIIIKMPATWKASKASVSLLITETITRKIIMGGCQSFPAKLGEIYPPLRLCMS